MSYGSPDDFVRVLRFLEYSGHRRDIEKTLENNAVPANGTKRFGDSSIRSAILGQFPEVVPFGSRVHPMFPPGLNIGTANLILDVAVDVAAKLYKKQDKLGNSYEYLEKSECLYALTGCLAKGDPIDCIAFLMFCVYRNWDTKGVIDPPGGTPAFPPVDAPPARDFGEDDPNHGG